MKPLLNAYFHPEHLHRSRNRLPVLKVILNSVSSDYLAIQAYYRFCCYTTTSKGKKPTNCILPTTPNHSI